MICRAFLRTSAAQAETHRGSFRYHGCDSSADITWIAPPQQHPIGLSIVEHAGFNEHAEANDIVTLYPQAHAEDCWNWDGEFPAPLTKGYDTRASVQIATVNRMVDAVAAALRAGRLP